MITIKQTNSSRGQGVHGRWILKYEISKFVRQDFVSASDPSPKPFSSPTTYFFDHIK
jgi:hypothetical protein